MFDYESILLKMMMVLLGDCKTSKSERKKLKNNQIFAFVSLTLIMSSSSEILKRG